VQVVRYQNNREKDYGENEDYLPKKCAGSGILDPEKFPPRIRILDPGGEIALTNYTLKGQCHEIFDPRFFSSNNPP
jgi:hypothetical protein